MKLIKFEKMIKLDEHMIDCQFNSIFYFISSCNSNPHCLRCTNFKPLNIWSILQCSRALDSFIVKYRYLFLLISIFSEKFYL